MHITNSERSSKSAMRLCTAITADHVIEPRQRQIGNPRVLEIKISRCSTAPDVTVRGSQSAYYFLFFFCENRVGSDRARGPSYT